MRSTASYADALVLTPSHQWPTGAVLSAEPAPPCCARRAADALVIEDDYDAEYRYDRAPIGAMQGLAPDLVAYAGTASKRSARAAAGLARRALLASSTPSLTPRSSPTAARPSSISSPSPTSCPVASSIATCAACAPCTGAAATRCSRPPRAHARARACRHRRRSPPRRLPARRRRRDAVVAAAARRGLARLRPRALSHLRTRAARACFRLRDAHRARAPRRGSRSSQATADVEPAS